MTPFGPARRILVSEQMNSERIDPDHLALPGTPGTPERPDAGHLLDTGLAHTTVGLLPGRPRPNISVMSRHLAAQAG